MSAVYFSSEPLVTLDDSWLARLKKEAYAAELKRARYCLHPDPDHPLQEMIIVHHQSSLDAPHRHLNKTISIYAVEGAFVIVVFDDAGNVVRRIDMAPPGSAGAFVFRLDTGAYFSLVPLTEYVIIHETLTGPHEKKSGFYPDWIPDTDQELATFLQNAARLENPE